MPSKYEPLHTHLATSPNSVVELTLSEVERVLGVSLPPAARRYQAWWANSGHLHAKTWTSAGFRASVDIPAQRVTFTKSGNGKALANTSSAPRPSQTPSGTTNSDRLIANQEKYFADSYAQFLEFGGPCVYFHEECLKAGENAFLSTRHIESLYATLTAWGMHRLGTKAKLVNWDVFRKSIEGCGHAVEHLRQTKLLEVSQ
jgi:hypothetical protein